MLTSQAINILLPLCYFKMFLIKGALFKWKCHAKFPKFVVFFSSNFFVFHKFNMSILAEISIEKSNLWFFIKIFKRYHLAWYILNKWMKSCFIYLQRWRMYSNLCIISQWSNICTKWYKISDKHYKNKYCRSSEKNKLR